MKLLPVISFPPNEKTSLPRQSLQHIGQVLVKIESEHVAKLVSFVEAHFQLVKVNVDVTKLLEDEVIKLLNAGVSQVICTKEQNSYVPEARRIEHFVQQADLTKVQPESAVFYECPNPKLEQIAHLPASATLITSVANLRLPTSPGPSAPASLVEEGEQSDASTLDIAQIINIGLKSDRPDGLYPTLVCNARNESLGLVYSSSRSIAESLRTGTGVYESRKRGLWYKGATSGDTQKLLTISWDCDDDALKFVVEQAGTGFCHLEQPSCFGNLSGLSRLETTLRERFLSAPVESYTARLFKDNKLLRSKILEEADELCDATSKVETAFEAADLFYFALTLCVSRGVSLGDIEAALDKKALKVSRRPGNAKPQYEAKVSAKEEKVVEEVKRLGDDPPIDNKESLNLKVYQAADVTSSRKKQLLRRPIKSNDEINNLVRPIINAVRTKGDSALMEFTKKFDGAELASPVLRAPFNSDLMRLPKEVQAAIDQAFSNIQKFHQAQLDNDQPISVETMPGVICSRFNKPIESVGLYVPGGTAVLPSTAMMLGVPALVAGCEHIIFASPPRKDGSLNPEIVYIAHKVGAEAILLAGGAQAVAALAYGTDSVRKCDKILGPGNQFVTAAKGLVSGDAEALVSIDMPAGPSEVLIIADSTSDPAFVASDLLSQAEHGADSQSILVGANLSSAEIAAIKSEVVKQALALPRCEILKKSIAHSYIYNAENLAAAIDFSNAYAPEHLIVYTSESSKDAKKITNAGSIFVGPYSPVACGDYASGTNHTLPTYGYARQYSGVNTGSFLKAITSQEITKAGLQELGKVVMTLAEVEGLDAHKNSVQILVPCPGLALSQGSWKVAHLKFLSHQNFGDLLALLHQLQLTQHRTSEHYLLSSYEFASNSSFWISIKARKLVICDSSRQYSPYPLMSCVCHRTSHASSLLRNRWTVNYDFVRSYRTKGAKNIAYRGASEKRTIRRTPLPPRPFLASPEVVSQVLRTFDGSSAKSKSNNVRQRTRKWTVPTIVDKDLIDNIIYKSGLQQFQDKVVLELNPGPGLFAERLLELVKPKKYIAIESRSEFIAPLQELAAVQKDTEIIVREADGFEWSAFSDLENDGVLQHEELYHDRTRINPNFVFIATAKTLQMEQLVAQWLDTIGTSSWLQKYGRVRMYLFVSRPIRQRLLAQPGSVLRAKGTFVREGTCDIREISHNPFVLNAIHEDRMQYQQDFDDLPQTPDSILARPDQYFPMTALSLLEVNPYEKSKITAPWETFEFIVKTLLMNKSTPLYQQIRTVASGAYALLAKLSPELRRKWPQDMTIEDMNEISVAFDAWPFKPRFLNADMDEVTDSRTKKYGRLIRSQVDVYRPTLADFELPDSTTDSEKE